MSPYDFIHLILLYIPMLFLISIAFAVKAIISKFSILDPMLDLLSWLVKAIMTYNVIGLFLPIPFLIYLVAFSAYADANIIRREGNFLRAKNGDLTTDFGTLYCIAIFPAYAIALFYIIRASVYAVYWATS